MNHATAAALTAGTILMLTPTTRSFAAEEGAQARVTERGLYWCTICQRNLIDIMWIDDKAYTQGHGGYDPRDFTLVAAEPLVVEPVEAKEPKLAPQTKAVLEMLQKIGRITGVQAANVLKVRALPRRIADLKEAGYKIDRTMKKDHTGQRYAEYSLAA